MTYILITFIQAGFAVICGEAVGLNGRRSFLLYVWHTFWTVVYTVVTSTGPSDSRTYFREGSSGFYDFSLTPGSSFIRGFSTLLHQGFSVDYMGTNLIVSFFGFIGLLLLCKLTIELTSCNRNSIVSRFCLLLPFLPSISFWSGGISKDTFTFLGSMMFLTGLQGRSTSSISWLLGGICVTGLLRPHVAAIMVVALFLGNVRDIGKSARAAGLASICILVLVASKDYLLDYVNLSTFEDYSDYISYRKETTLEGNYDTVALSAPLQILSFVFRPFLVEAVSATTLVSGLENLYLLLVTFCLFAVALKKVGKRWPAAVRFAGNVSLLYSICGICLLGSTIYNLGIAARQKWMFVPALVVGLMYYALNKSEGGLILKDE